MAKSKNLHPNHPVNRNPEFVDEVLAASSHPRSWLKIAKRLRSSAQVLFDHEEPVAKKFYDELGRVGRRRSEGNDGSEDWDFTRFPRPDFSIAFMLVAFAIENLLKGLALTKGITKLDDQKIPKNLLTHDLVKLAELAKPLANIGLDILETLHHSSEWYARYPLPTSVDQFWPMRQDGTLKALWYRWPDIQMQLADYLDQLESELAQSL